MESLYSDRGTICFHNLPNFREVSLRQDSHDDLKNNDIGVNEPTHDVHSDSNSVSSCTRSRSNMNSKAKLFRSSRPDFLNESEAATLMNELGVKTIVDFRSAREYKKAKGDKLLDRYFDLYKVKSPKQYRSLDKVNFTKIETDSKSHHSSSNKRSHYLVNFFRLNYIYNVFIEVPWYVMLYSLLFLVVDIFLNTGFKYFVGVFAKAILNKQGLIKQYQDMAEYSQTAICATLKLLADPKNLPAMINCAHGKDRTGIVTALILSIGGRSKEYIAKDYAKSEIGLLPVRDRVRKEIVERFDMAEEFTQAKEETMYRLLEYIENKYGSVKNYLEYIGFGETEQEKLRQNLMG